MLLRNAVFSEHKRLCQLARSHRAGNGFSNGLMFSGEEHYAKGMIQVAVATTGKIVGFMCFRHKVREPETKLYYIIVDPEERHQGIGQYMLNCLILQCAKHKIALDCLKDNAEALAFYRKNGFLIVGESLKGKGYKLEKTWS